MYTFWNKLCFKRAFLVIQSSPMRIHAIVVSRMGKKRRTVLVNRSKERRKRICSQNRSNRLWNSVEIEWK